MSLWNLNLNVNIKNGKSIITLLAFLNCELILLLCLGLAKKKYYAYFDKLVIKRSLRKNVEISYNDITKIKERKNDSILLGFGTRPSFTIYYKNTKKTIRTDNNDLFLKVIENEIKIANKNN